MPEIKIRKFRPLLIPYHEEVASIVESNIGIRDREIEEALVDVTGDLYFEMRKLTKEMMEMVERLIESGKYPGFCNGEPLKDKSKEALKVCKEDLKKEIRTLVDSVWKSIEKKQRHGITEMSKIISSKTKRK